MPRLPAIDGGEDGPVTVRYFGDEAGTPTLFDGKGRVIVGKDGCSTYFIIGKLDVTDPESLDAALTDLRSEILSDPFFQGVPSLDPAHKKTAILFHAKDDLPEIRDRVFHLLMEHDLRFSAVVRDKRRLAEQVRARNQADPAYRYRENEIYDEMVTHLFKGGFHEADHFEITFAVRGNKDRTAALKQAIENAQGMYQRNLGVSVRSTSAVRVSPPRFQAGLQAADYFLWALQRFYERAADSGEDRYWQFVWPRVRLVYDIDDTRERSFGAYYNQQKPLTRESRGA
jgi:hypothetical protein